MCGWIDRYIVELPSLQHTDSISLGIWWFTVSAARCDRTTTRMICDGWLMLGLGAIIRICPMWLLYPGRYLCILHYRCNNQQWANVNKCALALVVGLGKHEFGESCE